MTTRIPALPNTKITVTFTNGARYTYRVVAYWANDPMVVDPDSGTLVVLHTGLRAVVSITGEYPEFKDIPMPDHCPLHCGGSPTPGLCFGHCDGGGVVCNPDYDDTPWRVR
jgi:hypothetical protein